MRLLFLCVFLAACTTHKHGHNKANIHMHQKGHKELILAFDDPARDKWQHPEKVIALMGPLQGKKIIDIGSGSGYFTKYFLREKAQVVAADVDVKFLKHIEKSFPKKDYPHLSLMPIDYNDPKMAHNTYDFAFTSNTYHHIDNRIEYIKKVRRGLKVGGKFVVLDFKKNPEGGHHFGPPLKMRVSAAKVVDELIKGGLDHIEVYTTELEHQYIVIGKKIHE